MEALEIPRVHVEPSHGLVSLRLRELWAYRELLYFLTWRDIKVRYKQTALGIAWAILQPLLTMIVFSLIFGKLGKMPSEGKPYPLFTYTALLPWTFFAGSVTLSANSLVSSATLITRVYFPRLIIPISSVLSGLVDFGFAFLILGVLMVYYRGSVQITPAILLLPLFLLLAFVTALGVSLWSSALNVRYRDVRYIIPFLVQFWMYATPVIYPSKIISEPWRTLLGLNPMVGVIEGFRWALLGMAPPGPMFFLSVGVSIVILIGGLFYFRWMEKIFADVV